MNHRLCERVGHRDDHRGVLARRIASSIVLRADFAASFVQLHEREFPSAGDAIGFDGQHGYSRHDDAVPTEVGKPDLSIVTWPHDRRTRSLAVEETSNFVKFLGQHRQDVVERQNAD